MKHIFLNLKRFDISPEHGGVNRLAPMQGWGRAIVEATQEQLRAFPEAEFVMYMPEAHLIAAAAARTAGSPVKLGSKGVYRAIREGRQLRRGHHEPHGNAVRERLRIDLSAMRGAYAARHLEEASVDRPRRLPHEPI